MKKKNRRPKHRYGKKRPLKQLPDIDPKILMGAFIGGLIATGKITSIEFGPIDETKIESEPKNPEP